MPKTPEQIAAALVERALPCLREHPEGKDCDALGREPCHNCYARPAVIEAFLPVVRQNERLRAAARRYSDKRVSQTLRKAARRLTKIPCDTSEKCEIIQRAVETLIAMADGKEG